MSNNAQIISGFYGSDPFIFCVFFILDCGYMSGWQTNLVCFAYNVCCFIDHLFCACQQQ